MLRFLFKRNTNGNDAPGTATAAAPVEQPELATARQQALAQADALAASEQACADFILHCEFADARLKAAQHLHTKEMLELVAQRMRNTDRRVAKLIQQRLDTIAQQARVQQQARQCVDQAHQLMQQGILLPNHLVELDRQWQALSNVDGVMQEAFTTARAALQRRIEAQTDLQRAVLGLRDALQELGKRADDPEQSPEALKQALQELAQQLAEHFAQPEAAALPKHLLDEVAAQQMQVRQLVASQEQRRTALAAREQALAQWEAAPGRLHAEVLKKEWEALPVVPDKDAAVLQARFQALLARMASKPEAAVQPAEPKMALLQFSELLAALEQALAAGLLQAAAEHDKALRTMDTGRLPSGMAARLAKARAELGRLQGWAKWGGAVSREELLKAAQELPRQALPPAELARRVSSLRERWKTLDASAGPAPRELWERFDAACSTAYAPAAEHFRHLAEERRNNLAQAQAIIDKVRRLTAAMEDKDAEQVDWKDLASTCAHLQREWQGLGPLDRKDRKAAEAEFSAAIATLSQPLKAQQQAEAVRREQLIAEVGALNPADRNMPDALRALQQRWQERAKFLPLPHKKEQALWQRFRTACDRLFAQRKELARAADNERRQNLQKKEALCAALEAAADATPEQIGRLLQQDREGWRNTGPVPRAAEERIEARHKRALHVLQQRLQQARRHIVSDKLALCQTVEAWIAAGQAADSSELQRARADWEKLPPAAGRLEQALRRRFETAIGALENADANYAVLLANNQGVLQQQVLRLEILSGLDSPPELAAQRLAMQVGLLQTSLKSGTREALQYEALLQLLELAALADQQLAARIGRIIALADVQG